MTDNVISIFKKKDEETSPNESQDKSSLKDLEETMKANQARKEQQEKERQKSNKSVLKSYRIKK